MSVRTSAGSTLSISASSPATFNVAGYAALTYSEIGEITDFGEFGREYNLVTHNPVGSRGTQKFKGSFNEGTMDLELGLDNSDAGQGVAKSAVDSDANHSLKMVLQDGSIYYFQAQVMTFKIGVAGVDDITSATISLELTTNDAGVGIVEDLAP